MGREEDFERNMRTTDEALAASRAVHHQPRDFDIETRADVALEAERRNEGRGPKPRWAGDTGGRRGGIARKHRFRLLPLLGILAALAVTGAGGYGLAEMLHVDRQADTNTEALRQINEERRARSIASAEAVVRSCSNDNRQADYNDFLLNELVRGANQRPPPSTARERLVVDGLRKGIDALREPCRDAPLVRRVMHAYPKAHIPGLDAPAADGKRSVPIVQLR
jgi:hypothetical protein